MATAQEIQDQAAVVAVKSREVRGTLDLISAVSSVDQFTCVCLVNKAQIPFLIENLKKAQLLLQEMDGDPLAEGALLFNTGNEPETINKSVTDAVGNHLKAVFLPAALAAKQAERDAAVATLSQMINP